MESRVSNREAKSDEFKKSQEEFRISQAKFRAEFKATNDLILLQLKLLAEKLGLDSSAATPTHQPFIKSTSPISLEKSNEIVLKLQSFHKEKVRTREERDEFWSQFRPRHKPKTPPCLRPTLKKFKRVRDYAKYHEDGSAMFRSNPKFQGSFGVFRKALARKNENVFDLFDKEAKDSVDPPILDSDCKTGTTKELISGFPVFDCEFIGMEKKVAASKLLAKKGADSLLCDVGLCSCPEMVLNSVAKSGENDAHQVFVGLQQTVDIASLKLGFHEFTRDKGGTNIQRLLHSKSATVLESDGKDGKFQVFILEIHVSNVEFKKAKLPSSRALYLFDKMSNSGYILDIKLGYHVSIRDKGGTKFLSSFESMDLLASCEDSSCCVVCDVVLDRDYCKGIRDKGGGKLDYGLQLFKKMRIHDVFSWTSVITTYVWTGQEDRAIKAFIRMQEACVSPNEYTFAGVISRVANLARVEWGEQLHAHILHRGLISLKVKDRLSAFVAGERSHPQADDIYSVLELLASKAEDTIQKIGSSLIDVEG